MKLEDQVCSLEQAKRLNEIGVMYEKPQYAYIFRLYEFQLHNVAEFNRWAAQYDRPLVNKRKYYPAFTVAELGVMLPDMFVSRYRVGVWICYYDDASNTVPLGKSSDTEAQCRAAMLIHILENDIYDVEEVNNKLNK